MYSLQLQQLRLQESTPILLQVHSFGTEPATCLSPCAGVMLRRVERVQPAVTTILRMLPAISSVQTASNRDHSVPEQQEQSQDQILLVRNSYLLLTRIRLAPETIHGSGDRDRFLQVMLRLCQ